MTEIQKFTAEVANEGNGYLYLELIDGTVIPSVIFEDLSNFSAVCAMLSHTKVYYEKVNDDHKFISSN